MLRPSPNHRTQRLPNDDDDDDDDSGVTFLWSDSRVTILFMRFEPRVVPPAMYDEAPSYITI